MAWPDRTVFSGESEWCRDGKECCRSGWGERVWSSSAHSRATVQSSKTLLVLRNNTIQVGKAFSACDALNPPATLPPATVAFLCGPLAVVDEKQKLQLCC
jgi:hypothetical protein